MKRFEWKAFSIMENHPEFHSPACFVLVCVQSFETKSNSRTNVFKNVGESTLTSDFTARTRHLTSPSRCRSERPGCAATGEFAPVWLSPSSLPAGGPSRPRQLLSTQNNKYTSATIMFPLSPPTPNPFAPRCQLRSLFDDGGSRDWVLRRGPSGSNWPEV